ncbi:MAG: D-alanyl-D-alanine carboxypeptidase family protein [Roseburia sp.]
MKCINKLTAVVISLVLCGSMLTGCATNTSEFSNHYDVYHNTNITNVTAESTTVITPTFFSDGLCVGGIEDKGTGSVDSQVAGAAGVFNLATGEIPYSQKIYEKMYPASTTKILTAYIAIKYGNLDDTVTISENAVTVTSDSSVCDLRAGDRMTLRDLVYGLILRSGNDAAVAIAEHMSGSIEEFAQLMNAEAASMGATGSHFVNPNGLPDEDHYTTVYDMYLIFQQALSDETFYQVISTTNYTTYYTAADGSAASMEWTTTNQYLVDKQTPPDGFTVIGGKTGTTGEAGYCLVLLSTNASGDEIISIVFKADCRSNLYLLMNEILEGFGS